MVLKTMGIHIHAASILLIVITEDGI